MPYTLSSASQKMASLLPADLQMTFYVLTTPPNYFKTPLLGSKSTSLCPKVSLRVIRFKITYNPVSPWNQNLSDFPHQGNYNCTVVPIHNWKIQQRSHFLQVRHHLCTWIFWYSTFHQCIYPPSEVALAWKFSVHIFKILHIIHYTRPDLIYTVKRLYRYTAAP